MVEILECALDLSHLGRATGFVRQNSDRVRTAEHRSAALPERFSCAHATGHARLGNLTEPGFVPGAGRGQRASYRWLFHSITWGFIALVAFTLSWADTQ